MQKITPQHGRSGFIILTAIAVAIIVALFYFNAHQNRERASSSQRSLTEHSKAETINNNAVSEATDAPAKQPSETPTTNINTKPMITITTNLGQIELQLDAEKAPITVANFLKYVESGHYNSTIFHRVIPSFMIQGGGFESGMQQKPTQAPIQNEANNGLSNTKYTIAMARTSDPHSASAQFFINTKDNHFLDFTAESTAGWGYAVFGEVTAGNDVVDAIEKVATQQNGPFNDVPVEDVVIESIQVKP